MLDGYRGFSCLAVTQRDRLLAVTLNRPQALNAVNETMAAELCSLFRVLAGDESVGAVLLTGAGRSFSTGGDVKELAAALPRQALTASGGAQVGAEPAGAGPAEPAPGGGTSGQAPARRLAHMLTASRDLLSAMLDTPQPIVTAVHGYAIGLGATLALCSDAVIAAEDAVIADPHVSLGLVAGDGGAVIWPLLLPLNTAKYYLMTGAQLTGADAARLGLVLKAVPRSELEAEARGVAQRLAEGPALAIRWTKAVLNKILRERVNLLLDTSLALEGACLLSDDHAEAVCALLAKREPIFKGM